MKTLIATLIIVSLNYIQGVAQGITRFQYDTKRNQTVTTFTGTCTNLNSTTICSSLKSGPWHNGETWSCGRIPTIDDTVIIGPNNRVTIFSTVVQAKKIIYMSGGTLIYSSTGIKLQLKDG